jgi:DMSO/TMAO reductase YedYZ molybdopterin-dependent catalytic subunit
MHTRPITPRIFGERGRRRAVSLGIDPERLPPGQSPTVKWPVLSIEETPRLPTEQWTLTIDGAVQTPYTLDWAQLMAEPQRVWDGDLHCVTRWSKFDMRCPARRSCSPRASAGTRPTCRSPTLPSTRRWSPTRPTARR